MFPTNLSRCLPRLHTLSHIKIWWPKVMWNFLEVVNNKHEIIHFMTLLMKTSFTISQSNGILWTKTRLAWCCYVLWQFCATLVLDRYWIFKFKSNPDVALRDLCLLFLSTLLFTTSKNIHKKLLVVSGCLL